MKWSEDRCLREMGNRVVEPHRLSNQTIYTTVAMSLKTYAPVANVLTQFLNGDFDGRTANI